MSNVIRLSEMRSLAASLESIESQAVALVQEAERKGMQVGAVRLGFIQLATGILLDQGPFGLA